VTSERTALFALEQFGIKLGLDQIRGLIRALGDPDRAFRSVIVAGTNGKGSVTSMLERGFRAAGYRTGRYTSPHLVDLEERFAIDGVTIDARALDAAMVRVLDAARTLPAPPSFFEATTALAFDLFREARVDVAILEVGLGGRLDATNAAASEAAAITRIDFDHQQYLGDTLEAIAREKAGVIKPGALVVLADNPPVVEDVVADVAATVGARLVRAADGTVAQVEMLHGHARLRLTTDRRSYGPLKLALAGRHQVENAVTAVRLLEELDASGAWRIGEEAVRTALTDAVWPARLEYRMWGPHALLIDGAHNPAGARALATHIHETFGHPLPFVVGAMRDKDLRGILATLGPVASVFVCTAPQSDRAATPAEMAAVAAEVAPATPRAAVADPFQAITQASVCGSPIVVCGSLYLAGAVRAKVS
jgi:dihydrofolate synthase / folylpolyglutamate synthase